MSKELTKLLIIGETLASVAALCLVAVDFVVRVATRMLPPLMEMAILLLCVAINSRLLRLDQRSSPPAKSGDVEP